MPHSRIARVVTHAPHLGVAPAVRVEVERPGPLTKAYRLVRALRRWVKAGRPLTPRPELALRRAACARCEFQDPKGNFGFGQCRAPGCGCTQFKAWLHTETCPHPAGSRWPNPTKP